MKKILKFLKIFISLPFGLLLLAIGCLLIAFDINGSFNYADMPFLAYSIKSPSYVSVSKNNYACIIDKEQFVFVKDNDTDKSMCFFESNDFGYKAHYLSFVSSAFDDNDNLYVYYTVFNEDSYTTRYDCIAKIDIFTNEITNLVKFDYSQTNDSFNRSYNIFGLNVTDNNLNFIKRENDLEFAEYSYSLANGGYVKKDNIAIPNNNIQSACFAKGNGYAVLLTNGDLGYFKDGVYTEVYKNNLVDLFDLESPAIIPAYITYTGDKLYFITCIYSFDIYSVDENGMELIGGIEDLAYIANSSYFADYDFYNAFPFDNNGKVGLVVDDAIIYDYQNGEIDEGLYFVSPGFVLFGFLSGTAGIFGIIFAFIGIVISFGGFVKWKFSILTKQLIVILPSVVVAFVVIASFLTFELVSRYYNDLSDKMVAISKIGSSYFDADELSEIRNYDYVEDGKALEYHNILNKIVDDNNSEWSSHIDVSLFLYNYSDDFGTECYVIAKSGEYNQPFREYYIIEDYVDDLNNDVGYMFFDSSSNVKDYYVCDTAIKNSEGEVVGLFEVSTDNDDFTNDIGKIFLRGCFLMLILLVIIILFITLFSYINAKRLHNASAVVANIAKGDFSKRVKKTSKDEVGEICRGVNDMADKLDTLFKEKDENEHFYYKFVPEQFKEFLHKEKFTQLALGDAESIDLTVLFCDIRSFSISSEMMTAKENFEFINIIFGIAGPIIRKHNGFIDKYIGDAIMALFENAEDAVKCGEELYKSVVLDEHTAEMLNISSINIGIGIHTGMARIGIIGEEERMSGTVISNTVNLSSRLESLTKQYDTAMIITKDTLDRMEDPDSINTRYLGMVQVAGVNEVNALYEVLDCLDENRFNVRNANKKDFKEAVRLYHLGEFEKSVEMFESIKDDTGFDPVINKYIEYIKDNLAKGITDSKVFKFSRK